MDFQKVLELINGLLQAGGHSPIPDSVTTPEQLQLALEIIVPSLQRKGAAKGVAMGLSRSFRPRKPVAMRLPRQRSRSDADWLGLSELGLSIEAIQRQSERLGR